MLELELQLGREVEGWKRVELVVVVEVRKGAMMKPSESWRGGQKNRVEGEGEACPSPRRRRSCEVVSVDVVVVAADADLKLDQVVAGCQRVP